MSREIKFRIEDSQGNTLLEQTATYIIDGDCEWRDEPFVCRTDEFGSGQLLTSLKELVLEFLDLAKTKGCNPYVSQRWLNCVPGIQEALVTHRNPKAEISFSVETSHNQVLESDIPTVGMRNPGLAERFRRG